MACKLHIDHLSRTHGNVKRILATFKYQPHGLWYRNDAGSFTGPYGLRSAAPEVNSSSFDELIYVADTDDDNDLDIVIFDAVYERVPEPSALLGLGLGSGLLFGLSRRRWKKARRT